MGIVTKPIREIIKVAMVTKYIDSCGIKMPQKPHIPNFKLPEMPNLDLVYKELNKISNAVNALGNDSIYTSEYLDAYKKYNELSTAAAEKYKSTLKTIENKYNGLEETADAIKKINAFYEKAEEEKTASDIYADDIKQAKLVSNIENVTKFKRIDAKEKKNASKAAAEETNSKKNKEKNEALELMNELVLKQYTDWLKSESEKAKRFAKELTDAYNDTVNLFKTVKKEAKEYFQDEGGAGSKFIDSECDKIDRIWDNFTESFKELGVDITAMTAKIPNPDVIVCGAATGIPNPAQKIMIFMENLKKVMTDIKKIANYIKEITGIALAIGFAIEELVPAFKNLCGQFEAAQKNVDNEFKQAVKQIRKKQKWYLEHEHPDETGETKKAGYMYADVEVDWNNKDITLKGYKCYCTKDYAKLYTEGLEVKKSMWIGGYRKNQGTNKDSAGKYYYYLPPESIGSISEDDSDMIEDGEEYDVDLGAVGTSLNLSDGRTITIDYLAASGDVIRLDDGSIIKIK